MSLQEQPLSIDYLSLIGEADSDTNVRTGFLKPLVPNPGNYRFLLLRLCNSVWVPGDRDIRNHPVWFGGGREQAELLKSLIDDSFSKGTGIGVNLQLVTIPLSQAVLAGTAPDVSLSTVRSQPVNLGARVYWPICPKWRVLLQSKRPTEAICFCHIPIRRQCMRCRLPWITT